MRIDPDREAIASVLKSSLAQVVASDEWFESRILPLSVDQLRWRPRVACWSVAECLDHLNRTFGYYLPKIEQAMDRGCFDGPDPIHGLVFIETEGNFLQQVEPPVLVAMSAPAVLVPNPAVDPDQIMDQFPQLRRRFEKAVESSPKLAVLNIMISESVHPSVQSLGGVIAMLAAHERRHLWQAQRVMSESRFPAALQQDDRGGREDGEM